MSELTRRSFLGGVAALGLCGVQGATFAPFGLETVTLGKTGLRTTRLGFGTGVSAYNRSSEIERKLGKEGAIKLVRAAYERGIRYFDTADSYGTHVIVREALRPFPRESYVLSTKIWFAGGGIPAADHTDVPSTLARFLRELGTDYLDIVQFHCVTDANWPRTLAPQMAALEQSKKAGLVRAHGCTFHSFGALEAATREMWIDCAHVRLNHKGRHMSTTPERQMAAAKKLHARGVGIIGMKLLGMGSFSAEQIDASLEYVASSQAVDVFNIGFLSIAQVDDILRRLDKVRPVKVPCKCVR